MSINFRFFRASGRVANGGSHYVRPVVNNVLTLNDLAARVESETSFSVSDVKGLVEAFQKYIAVELSLGHSVRIDGLGTFSSALSGILSISLRLSSCRMFCFWSGSCRPERKQRPAIRLIFPSLRSCQPSTNFPQRFSTIGCFPS